jgi:hypothetical protein
MLHASAPILPTTLRTFFSPLPTIVVLPQKVLSPTTTPTKLIRGLRAGECGQLGFGMGSHAQRSRWCRPRAATARDPQKRRCAKDSRVRLTSFTTFLAPCCIQWRASHAACQLFADERPRPAAPSAATPTKASAATEPAKPVRASKKNVRAYCR